MAILEAVRASICVTARLVEAVRASIHVRAAAAVVHSFHGRLWSFMVVSAILFFHCRPWLLMVVYGHHGRSWSSMVSMVIQWSSMATLVGHGPPWSPWSPWSFNGCFFVLVYMVTMVVHGFMIVRVALCFYHFQYLQFYFYNSLIS